MKDVIRLSAARNGIRVVQDYNQGGDPNVLSGDDLLEGGMCLALTANWLRCKRDQADFWAWLRSPGGIAKIRFIMASQATGDKLGNSLLKTIPKQMSGSCRWSGGNWKVA